MYLYQKTIKPKNTAGKITALLCLLCGAALFLLASGGLIAAPALAQMLGLILLTTAIYIASVFLLREYTFSVEPGNREDDEDAAFSERFDFKITERKGKREIKVCHLGMNEIKKIRVMDPTNKRQIDSERKNMKRFTYNTEFAASKKIEITAKIDGEDYSIIVTYNEELLHVLEGFFK